MWKEAVEACVHSQYSPYIYSRIHMSPIFLVDVSALRNVGVNLLMDGESYTRRKKSTVLQYSGVWLGYYTLSGVSEEITASIFRL